MSGIESNIMPFVSTIGFGGIVGFLIGFMLKRIMKILAVIAGVFFAALLYLESQHIVNVNWDKLQSISNSVLSTIETASLGDICICFKVSSVVSFVGCTPRNLG